jgi:hypothetical protein
MKTLKKFLFRSDWTFTARGGAHMKLHHLLQKCSFFLIKLAAVQARGDAHMKLQMFGTVGRATVPAETGRHGGRPYDSARPKFLFRFDWPLFLPAAGLNTGT